MAVPALLLAFIHPSAWNRNSAKFALREFSEVRKESFKVVHMGDALGSVLPLCLGRNTRYNGPGKLNGNKG